MKKALLGEDEENEQGFWAIFRTVNKNAYKDLCF